MPRFLPFLLTLATLSVANAQSADPAVQVTTPNLSSQSSSPAPIVRAYGGTNVSDSDSGMPANRPARQDPQIRNSQPVPGVWIRSEANTAIETVSATPKNAEFRLTHGKINVDVHRPESGALILVDLPNGQTALLKDGLYTFNADTDTIRVLKGEADAYPGALRSGVKPIKVKEDHQLAFTSAANITLHAVEAYRFELTADLLPTDNGDGRNSEGYPRGGSAPYGYGFYGYPYFAGGWASPWGYGYPYGGGLGFGYYGGFRGGYGGFRGGYGGFGGFRR